MPTDAPGWIVQRYESLVGNCGKGTTTLPQIAPTTTTPPAAATTTAPSN